MRDFKQEEVTKLALEIEKNNFSQLRVPTRLTKPHLLIQRVKNHFNSINNTSHFLSRSNSELNLRVSKSCLRRALIFYDTFIKLCEARGHLISVADFKTWIDIKNIRLEIGLREPEKVIDAPKKYDWESKKTVPSGSLCFCYYSYYPEKEWYDAKTIKLEHKLSQIMAYLELTADSTIRWNNQIENNRRSVEQKREIELHQQALKDDELKKFKHLTKQSKRWSEYRQLIDWINLVKKENLKPTEWIEWAEKKAEWLDPREEIEDEILGPYPR